MRNDRPIFNALIWVALGFAVATLIFIVVNAMRGSSQELNDETLDELARQHGR
jgi:heme exporter protein D